MPVLLLGLWWHVGTVSAPVGSATGDYCERVRASFERVGKWAWELATALESLDAEGTQITAERLGALRGSLESEAELLHMVAAPPGTEEIQTRGAAAVELLLTVADPQIAEAASGDRDDLGVFLRDQFAAARGEARAAAAALRQNSECAARRAAAQGSIRLLSRARESQPH